MRAAASIGHQPRPPLQQTDARSTFPVLRHATQNATMIRLTPPSTPAFLISLLLGGAGIAGRLGYFPIAAPNAFWLLTTAFALLLLSTLFKDL